MRGIIRTVRCAPARILASVFALTLALGAMGVLAVPDVATSSLRAAAQQDHLAQITVDVTDTGDLDLGTLQGVDGIESLEGQVRTAVGAEDGSVVTVLGVDTSDQRIDIVRADEGRLPAAAGEVLVTDGLARIGDVIAAIGPDGDPTDLRIVGIGGTSAWEGDSLAFTTLDTARSIAGIDGANRLVARTASADADALDASVAALRTALAADRVTMTTLPITLPGDEHPIEADIAQVSLMIGLLGVVAGLVALVLLASTTTTLITERTREIAVMRALGGRRRALRRRLRRLALGIAAAAVVLGVPLGIAVSNLLARIVLDETLGLTPGFAVSVPVMVGSAAFALIGARLVAGRAARRITEQSLAEALRDRDAAPFGRRLSERLAARLPLGGLFSRLALRNSLHRRAGSATIVAQLSAAVASLLVIATLVTTVNAFNDAEYAHWRWSSVARTPDGALTIDDEVAVASEGSEADVTTIGELDGWQMDVYGMAPDSTMVDTTVDAGRWYERDDEIVVSTGFAARAGVDLGERVDVELASGTSSYEVVGFHPSRGRYVFTDRDALAAELGAPGMSNILFSDDTVTPAALAEAGIPVAEVTQLSDGMSGENGRDLIVYIFGAIGLVIVGVATLAVGSALAVNVFERRYAFATMRALGGRRRDVLRAVVTELLPIAALAVALGVGLGYLGSLGIVTAFEQADAVEIGLVFATGAIPIAAAAVVGGALLLGAVMSRQVTRRTPAVTLRGAV